MTFLFYDANKRAVALEHFNAAKIERLAPGTLPCAYHLSEGPYAFLADSYSRRLRLQFPNRVSNVRAMTAFAYAMCLLRPQRPALWSRALLSTAGSGDKKCKRGKNVAFESVLLAQLPLPTSAGLSSESAAALVTAMELGVAGTADEASVDWASSRPTRIVAPIPEQKADTSSSATDDLGAVFADQKMGTVQLVMAGSRTPMGRQLLSDKSDGEFLVIALVRASSQVSSKEREKEAKKSKEPTTPMPPPAVSASAASAATPAPAPAPAAPAPVPAAAPSAVATASPARSGSTATATAVATATAPAEPSARPSPASPSAAASSSPTPHRSSGAGSASADYAADQTAVNAVLQLAADLDAQITGLVATQAKLLKAVMAEAYRDLMGDLGLTDADSAGAKGQAVASIRARLRHATERFTGANLPSETQTDTASPVAAAHVGTWEAVQQTWRSGQSALAEAATRLHSNSTTRAADRGEADKMHKQIEAMQRQLEEEKRARAAAEKKAAELASKNKQLATEVDTVQSEATELKQKLELLPVFEKGLTELRKVLEDEIEHKQTLQTTVEHLTQLQSKYKLTFVPVQGVKRCMACNAKFALFNVGSHAKRWCRHCGRLFCKACCSHTAPLPQLGFADKVPICKNCSTLVADAHWEDEKEREKEREEAAEPGSSGQRSGAGAGATTAAAASRSGDGDASDDEAVVDSRDRGDSTSSSTGWGRQGRGRSDASVFASGLAAGKRPASGKPSWDDDDF